VQLSSRSLSAELGVARGAAAGAMRALVATGLLVRLPAARDDDGRFGPPSYLLRLPVGLAVSGVAVAGPTAPGPAAAGLPAPGLAVAGGPPTAKPASKRRPGRSAPGNGQERSEGPEPEPARQGSLFGAGPRYTGSGKVAARSMGRPAEEPIGGPEPAGCKGPIWAHELAPVVRAGPGPHGAPFDRDSPDERSGLC
jgi:hypothetical protein